MTESPSREERLLGGEMSNEQGTRAVTKSPLN